MGEEAARKGSLGAQPGNGPIPQYFQSMKCEGRVAGEQCGRSGLS